MISLNYFKHKRVGVLGFGLTGRSVVDSLILGEASVFLYDDLGIKDEVYKKYSANLLDDKIVKSLDAIVLSPGIHLFWDHPHRVVSVARKFGVPLFSDLDLFQIIKSDNEKIIAITGTNGKSTTTALTHHIFEQAKMNADIGGNFGKPILSSDRGYDFYILELSSYQLEQSNILGFDTAVLLNITPDHLTRHGGLEGYVSAKQKIFINSKKSVVSVDDDHCSKIADFLKKTGYLDVIPISGSFVPKFGIGWKNDCLIDNRFESEEVICEKHSLLDGKHNRQNIAATYAVCISNGVKKSDFVKYLKTFTALNHRQEFVASINGIQYINDSKATNADSVEQALLRFNNIFWILGGRPKEGGIFSLQKYFSKIKYAFLIGEVAEEWNILLSSQGVKSEIAKTLEKAVARAYEESKKYKPDVVLLSPACASFDQFKSFEERGDKFKEYVMKLKK